MTSQRYISESLVEKRKAGVTEIKHINKLLKIQQNFLGMWEFEENMRKYKSLRGIRMILRIIEIFNFLIFYLLLLISKRSAILF